jgi:hypothetical protein
MRRQGSQLLEWLLVEKEEGKLALLAQIDKGGLTCFESEDK